MRTLRIPEGFFSANPIDDITQRLDLGVVHFWFLYKNPEEHDGEVLREAFGTRNMLMSFIDWNDIPMDLKTPPEHVRTYFDAQKNEWRCFIKSNLVKYTEIIYVDDELSEQDLTAVGISDEQVKKIFDINGIKTYRNYDKNQLS